jgi:hypothetical protein
MNPIRSLKRWWRGDNIVPPVSREAMDVIGSAPADLPRPELAPVTQELRKDYVQQLLNVGRKSANSRKMVAEGAIMFASHHRS